MDELSRNAQMIVQMLHFGAYQEILGVDGAKPLGTKSSQLKRVFFPTNQDTLRKKSDLVNEVS